MFKLYTHSVDPNGHKVAVALSELGLTYRSEILSFGSNPVNGTKTPHYEAFQVLLPVCAKLWCQNISFSAS